MTTLKTSTIFITIFAIILVFVLAFSSGDGIVQIGGYSEAVAFCGDEITWVVFDPEEATVRYDEENNITYVINKGHEKDMEVVELMAVAEITCSQFKEEK